MSVKTMHILWPSASLLYSYVFKLKNYTTKVIKVAKGFRQMHWMEYNETFTPVASHASEHAFLAIVSYNDLQGVQ